MQVLPIILTELFGTALLILLGNGVVANVLLKGTKGQNAGWITITFGWGFAVLVAALISAGLGGVAHLNPAVTIMSAIAKRDWGFEGISHTFLPTYGLFIIVLIMQFIGAALGSFLVDFLYWKHVKETSQNEPEEFKNKFLAMHSTGPSNRNVIFNFSMEVIGTLVLLFAVVAVGHFVTIPFVQPIVVGLTVAVIGISLGGTTGYAINPARDLSPRIVHQIIRVSNKGSSDWQYSWIPIVGPLLASVVVGLIARFALQTAAF